MNPGALPPRHVGKDPGLLAQDFARTGLMIRPGPAGPPARFQVLGERASGTNLAKRLLGRNSGIKPSEALGWKHGFVQALAVPPDMAVICMIRNAEDWALSMFARPWHCSTDMQRLEFPDFIRAPWDTRIDRARYFGGDAAKAILGQPLQQDRDPLTGARFANIFALRRAKLAHLLSWPGRDTACVLLRAETLQADPETTVHTLLTGLGHAPRAPFRPVHKRLGTKFAAAVPDRPPPPDRLSEADRAFLRAELDLDLEQALGYSYPPQP